MYRMLIVDDEIHVVKGLMASLNLERLQISSVYSAFNIRQAKEVLLAHPVDIMLCDIEMPQGSGLELLEWARTQSPNTETIFLTSHADFAYAKQAIQLGCLDYLLKPVPDEELEKTVIRLSLSDSGSICCTK
jgi:two-component system, response regulator YesN